MTIRSLGYRTDLFFFQEDSRVEDRGEYVVVRSPLNPTFHWGNFLLFDRPPGSGDFERWRDRFTQEIGRPPEIEHVALGIDGVEGEMGDVQAFTDAGFKLLDSIVLTARSVRRPPKTCEELVVRPISGDREWEAVIENQVLGRDPVYGEEGFREYTIRSAEHYRRMIARGQGLWFGAFVEGRLAGDLGLFVFDGVGRFQTVGTHPDFRRRGVCGTLVYAAAQYGLREMGAETLVMVADAHYHAAWIYESVGFAPTERQVGLTFWER